MPKIVVEGPDGRKFAFPDTMPRAEINAFMRTKYGTKAPNETVQDYLARYGREQAATEARVKDIDLEATAAGRAEGERAAERMGVSNPFEMAFAAPAIGLAQQEGGRRVFEREGTVLADEAAGLSAINAAGFFVPGMVNREFGARVEEGRRQQPLAAFAGDVAGGFGPGEIIGAGVAKAVQAVGPSMAALGRMFSGQKISPEMQSTLQQTAMGSIGGSAYGNFNDVNQDGVIDQKDVYAGAVAGGVGLPATVKGAQVAGDFMPAPRAAPRVAPDAMPAGGYFGRQSMRPPGSGPSPREIEIRQEWSTATPIVTQARTTAQTAQQSAEAALQTKAPADIARAKAEKKALVGQLQEAQASRAGMNTPEDARLAETLASLTENTSDPVLLSTQISAAKTSLDRLLTDIGSPVEGNLIPVRTNILTRTQAPRSAAEGPQDRPSVTRYAEGGDEIKPQGFGAGGSKVNPEAVRSAKSEGFDTSRILYRGMRDPLGPDGLYATTTPGYETQGLGVSLSTSAKAAAEYGGNVYPVVVKGKFFSEKEYVKRINKLYETQGIGSRDAAAQVRAELAAEGYAGLKADGGKLLDKGELRVWGDDSGLIPNAKVVNDTAPSAPPPISPMGFGASTPKTPQQAARFETPGSPEYQEALLNGDIRPTSEELYDALRQARKDGNTDVTEIRAIAEAVDRIENGAIVEVIADAFKKFPVAREVADRQAMGYTNALMSDERAAIAIVQRAIAEARLQNKNPETVFNEALTAYASRFGDPEDAAFMRQSITDLMNMGNLNKSTSSTLLAASPFAAVGGAGLTSERELGSKMKRDKKD
jgi:hypothetical protein